MRLQSRYVSHARVITVVTPSTWDLLSLTLHTTIYPQAHTV